MYIEQTSWPTSLNLMNGLSDLIAGKKTYLITKSAAKAGAAACPFCLFS